MNRHRPIIALAVLLASPLAAVAQALGNHAIATDATASKLTFQFATSSGAITYRPVYPAGWERAIVVTMKFASGQPLGCFTYGDFRYDLQNGEGKRFPLIDLPRTSEVFPLHDVSPHDCMSSTAVPRTVGRAYFNLDALFGKLEPGKYKLALALAPRNHNDLAVQLPAISFEVTDR